MTDIEEILGFDNDPRPKPIRRNPKLRTSRGPLHDLLTRALPDLTGAGNVCDLHKLAKMLGLTPQGVYKWMRPGRENRIPPNQVDRIVALSNKQKGGGSEFTPVRRDDFWEFLAS